MNDSSAAITTSITPTTPEELQEVVIAHTQVLPHGGGSKKALLHTDADQVTTLVDMTQLAGITEYEPSEYTFTAYAGTRLKNIASTLAEYGQYMPFDPPFLEQGATLGGAIASGLSASGRYRYGGIRDFILGVHFVDGQGRLIRGGGKVVKNAAGFDLPKLMVGSMGRLGVLVSASFKVFPAPPATATLQVILPSLAEALATMHKLMGGPYDLEALDLLPQRNGKISMLVRIGGPANVLSTRLERLSLLVGNGEFVMDDLSLWMQSREFSWVEGNNALVKVATTSKSLPTLHESLQAAECAHRFAVGGNVAWISWSSSIDSLHAILSEQALSGVVVRGDSDHSLIGKATDTYFRERIRAALDPTHRFAEIR